MLERSRLGREKRVMPFARRIALIVFALGVTCASAQDFPNRYIRVIVGPGLDAPARLYGAKMAETLGQQVVIEPRPGAGGAVAIQAAASAAPDGYTLLLATAAYTINTALGQIQLDLRKDFAPIGLVTTVKYVLVLHPSIPARDLGELSAALDAGFDDAELHKRVLASGYEPARRNTPEDFGRFIAADTAKWTALVAKINLKMQ